MRLHRLWVPLLAGLLAVCACFAPKPFKKNAGKTVFTREATSRSHEVSLGETFRIELPANATTGYEWKFKELDGNLLRVDSSGYDRSSNPKLAGAGGTAWWELRALQTGKTVLRLLYYRPWEGEAKSGDEFNLSLSVEKP
ncbi:MAG TPA: hypothetical protein DCM05_05185 [Elusimicrobia bacterium]|nr:hypothetical protein [Elusimicrobiota bacterium]